MAKTSAKDKIVVKKELSDEEEEDESAPPLLEMETCFDGEKLGRESVERSASSDDHDEPEMSVYEFIQSKLTCGQEGNCETPSTSYPDHKFSEEPRLSQLLSPAPRVAVTTSTSSSSSGLKRPYDNGKPLNEFRWMTLAAEESIPVHKNLPKRTRMPGETIQHILRSMKPVQVDVAVGNQTGTTSSTSHDNSPDQSPEDEVRQKLKMAVRKKVGDSIVKDASSHSILLGCMVINGVNQMAEHRRAEFCHEIYSVLSKFGVK